jgi:rfaE bifunctional protein nucleotidyltransferase chain/domain
MEISRKDELKNRIISLKEAEKLHTIYPNRRIVLVGGCYDIIHIGHLRFFERARAEGNLLVVALESDEFIRSRKKREPVHEQEERAEILAALRFVDVVIMLPLLANDEQYFDMVKKVKPSVIAVTEGDAFLAQKKEQAEHIGAQVKEVIPLLSNYSTTKIINYASISSNRVA